MVDLNFMYKSIFDVPFDILTPGMKQFFEIKKEYRDCLVLIRMGDFYETFYEDAFSISEAINITLTARGKSEKRAPLAGIPYHALDNYLSKLVNAGFKIALVEQLEDPKKAKGLVKRGVVRVITPGTVIESSILDESSNNYILSVYLYGGDKFSISICDISTGEFLVTNDLNSRTLFNELYRFNPSEILFSNSLKNSELVLKIKNRGYYCNFLPLKSFDFYSSFIKDKFKVISLSSFGLDLHDSLVYSSGMLLNYLILTQMVNLDHISSINYFSISNFMFLDFTAQRNLELVKTLSGNVKGSLLHSINKTVTSMGARKLKRWIVQPLLNLDDINYRLDAVTDLNTFNLKRAELVELLKNVVDFERILSKLSYGQVNPKDLVSLKLGLSLIPLFKTFFSLFKSNFFNDFLAVDDLNNLVKFIESSILNEPNTSVREGNIIKNGFSEELDELRFIAKDSKTWLLNFENSEREKYAIKNLKISYNRIFGYFIEVPKSQLNLVPEHYIRKQTQANSERYFTSELKEKEEIILTVQNKINELEFNLFSDVILKISEKIIDIQKISDFISSLDCFQSFATLAFEENYVRPSFISSFKSKIVEGRHPVVEKITSSFVSNDTLFSDDSNFHVITGPNMAGKSTYMRQVALIQLLSQIGSFVPAKDAVLNIVDRIFTRIGAHDDLYGGQSTFMVEMVEAANILNNATEKSLIILDEIGRGTSTYDGVSLALSIAEHICSKIKCKTLFATHYHQLGILEKQFNNVSNFKVLVSDSNDDIIFLRKVILGFTDKSYGIHVAKIAGIPDSVIKRANSIMSSFEQVDSISETLHSVDEIDDNDDLLNTSIYRSSDKSLNDFF